MAAPALYSSSALEAGAVASTKAVIVDEVLVHNSDASDLYLHVFGAAAIGATSEIAPITVPAGQTMSWSPKRRGMRWEAFSVGLSTTPLSHSAAGAVGAFTVFGASLALR